MFKSQFNILIMILVGVTSYGLFDYSQIKTKLLHWNMNTDADCPSNGATLQNLLTFVCNTAQANNITQRDACIACFSRITSMPESPRELYPLSLCAVQYFVRPYAGCATTLMSLATSGTIVLREACDVGYCDFVHCLTRHNSANLIELCAREARTGINLTVDRDSSRFYKNITSCVLAKSRCDRINPITGQPQIPGYTDSGVRISNAVQISDTGALKVLSFPVSTAASTEFCTLRSNLTQTNWLTNVC